MNYEEGDTLHDSHRWDDRGEVAVCRDCRVEGYDDESAAFAPCVIGPPPPPPSKTCPATLASRDTPGHVHQCRGGHTEGHHLCVDCRRWFGTQ